MNERERAEYLEDGLSSRRRQQFLISDQVSREWQRRHPWSLDEYFHFLETLQDMFGPFPLRRDAWIGNDFRL
jgi:hypothetical protein